MSADNLDALILDNNNNPTIISTTISEKLKQYAKEICISMNCSSNEYNPSKTIEIINNFIATDNKMFRILYSELYKQT